MSKKLRTNPQAGAGAVSDPSSWPALLWRFFMLHPLIVCGVALLLVFGYVGVKVVGKESLARVLSQTSVGDNPPHSDRPFEVLSITMMLRQKDIFINGREERHLYVRTIYTIRGMRGLPPTSDAMKKLYRKSEAREIRRWHGNVEQAISSMGPTIIETVARFGIQPGEVKTVVFGTEVISDLPFPEHKYRAINDLVKLRPDEAWWGYPNNDGMTIPEITILIESETNDLKVSSERPAFRVTAEGTVDHREVATGRTEAKAGTECLWARWNNVKEKELIAFRYTWGQRKE